MSKDTGSDIEVAVLAPGTGAKMSENAQGLGHICYTLHALVAAAALIPTFQVSIVVLLVAFFIDLIKKSDYPVGSIERSHFTWRLKSVVWAMGLYVVSLPLWLLVIPGWIAWALISLWFAYRITKGWIKLSEGKGVE